MIHLFFSYAYDNAERIGSKKPQSRGNPGLHGLAVVVIHNGAKHVTISHRIGTEEGHGENRNLLVDALVQICRAGKRASVGENQL